MKLVELWEWDARRMKAARLIAQGRLTNAEICAKVEVSQFTLWNWKKHPAFIARVKKHVQRYGEIADRLAIANRYRRIEALDDRWRRLHEIIKERGEDPAMQDVPGGKTGLLVKETTFGTKSTKVKYALDRVLLAEIRELEKQASIELGQWDEKKTVINNQINAPMQFTIIEKTVHARGEIEAIEVVTDDRALPEAEGVR